MIKSPMPAIIILLSLILGLINNNSVNDNSECKRLLNDIAEKIKVLKKTLSAPTTMYYKGYNDIVRAIDNYIRNNHGNLSCRELVLIHEIIDTIILNILEDNNIYNARTITITEAKAYAVNITTKSYAVLYNRIKSRNSSTIYNIPLNENTTANAINYHGLISSNTSVITIIQLNRLNYTHIFTSNHNNSKHKTLAIGLGIQIVLASIITIIMLVILLVIMFKPRF